MPFFSYLDDSSAMVDILGRYPDKYRALCEFTEGVLRGPSALTPGEREMIFAYASGLNDCDFCYGTHTAAAEQFGIDPALFTAMLDDVETSGVEARMKPILKFVGKLTRTPSRMTKADADAVFAAGWSEEDLEDAINACAIANFYNRVVDGHGIVAGGEAFFRARGEALGKHGYLRAEIFGAGTAARKT